MKINCSTVLGSLVLLLFPLSSCLPALSHSYSAGLQRRQAAKAIAMLMCDRDNRTITQEEYENKFNELRFIHISVDRVIQDDHTHLVPDRNKGPEVMAVAKEMKNNLDKDCFVITESVHEKLADKAHAICTLSKQLCIERDKHYETLVFMRDRFKKVILPLAVISQSEDVEMSEREEALEKFCLLADQHVEFLKEKAPIWNELGRYVEEVATEQDQNFWWQTYKGVRDKFCS